MTAHRIPTRGPVWWLAVLVATAGSAIAPAASQAHDSYPCRHNGSTTLRWQGGTMSVQKYYCPLTRAHVPVYHTVTTGSGKVGELVRGGSVNWFVAEVEGARVTYHGATNVWWASTMADNGRIGWVPEVYFRGGAADEDDAGLLAPPSVYTCAAPPSGYCPPIPPWYRPPSAPGTS